MAYEDPAQVVASAARTTSGNSGSLPCPKGLNLAVAVAVTAVSGTTPSMALTVEWSHDGTTFFTVDPAADSFTAITAATNVVKAFVIRGNFYRLSWALTGTTPSFTFSASRYVSGD